MAFITVLQRDDNEQQEEIQIYFSNKRGKDKLLHKKNKPWNLSYSKVISHLISLLWTVKCIRHLKFYAPVRLVSWIWEFIRLQRSCIFFDELFSSFQTVNSQKHINIQELLWENSFFKLIYSEIMFCFSVFHNCVFSLSYSFK